MQLIFLTEANLRPVFFFFFYSPVPHELLGHQCFPSFLQLPEEQETEPKQIWNVLNLNPVRMFTGKGHPGKQITQITPFLQNFCAFLFWKAYSTVVFVSASFITSFLYLPGWWSDTCFNFSSFFRFFHLPEVLVVQVLLDHHEVLERPVSWRRKWAQLKKYEGGCKVIKSTSSVVFCIVFHVM